AVCRLPRISSGCRGAAGSSAVAAMVRCVLSLPEITGVLSSIMVTQPGARTMASGDLQSTLRLNASPSCGFAGGSASGPSWQAVQGLPAALQIDDHLLAATSQLLAVARMQARGGNRRTGTQTNPPRSNLETRGGQDESTAVDRNRQNRHTG